MSKFLNYGKQWIDNKDIKAVVDVLKSDFLTKGPKVKEFEEAICDYTGAKYCIAVCNGTAALHLAVASLEIEKGKEGITSPITFVATSNSMIYNGLKPIFADIKRDTYCIDPEKIKEKISKDTKLLIPVHFAGQPCEMEVIQEIAKENNLFVLEDAAHAIGSKYADGTHVGNCKYSDLTIFSFHPVKTITTGEGGSITTNNHELYERLLSLREHGIIKDNSKFITNNSELREALWYHEMRSLGFNYRITDIQASLGISQLKKLENFVERRSKIVKKYNNSFKEIAWLTTPYERPGVYSAFHLYVLQFDFNKLKKSRNQIMKELENKNIGTQVHYIPVHTQPYYQNQYGYKWGDYPISEEYYEKALSIPLYPKMTDEEDDYIIDSIIGIEI